MFNSTAIEVVIGLVFIYILYSLLVTILVELVSSLISLRGQFLKKAIRRMLEGDDKSANKKPAAGDQQDQLSEDSKAFVEEFWQRPEIRYLGNKFLWKKRPPSYISPTTFSATMVNVIDGSGKVKKKLKAYKKLLEEKIDRTGTEDILYSFLVEAKGDADVFKRQLERWYNETMDRVGGWYKRRLQFFTFLLGLLVAFSLNVDTISIARKLTAESNIRMEMVKLATDYVSQADSSDATSIIVKEEMKEVIADIKHQESILSMEWPPFDLCDSAFWLYVLGCFITTIAISLGAPFWFDILNKVSKLRSAGTQENTDKMDANTFKSKKQTT